MSAALRIAKTIRADDMCPERSRGERRLMIDVLETRQLTEQAQGESGVEHGYPALRYPRAYRRGPLGGDRWKGLAGVAEGTF